MKKISIIIPAYNEEAVLDECNKRIKKVCNSLTNYDHEIIYVNDGSKDNTLNILSELATIDNTIKVVSLSRNFGHQCAVTAGLAFTSRRCCCYN